MNNPLRLVFLALSLLSAPALLADWPAWRGPTRDGHAPADAKPVLKWSGEENIVWRTEIPGRGHASPTVVGGLIFLATADKEQQTQSVLALDQASGEIRWTKEVHQGGLPKKIHAKNTHASPTIASDGKHLLVVFHREDAAFLSCLDSKTGEIIWSKRTGAFVSKYPFGYAPSPMIYGKTVIMSCECKPEGFLAAYRITDGEEIWRVPRNLHTSYSSPVLGKPGGKEQILLSGFELIDSYDPKTGEKLWSSEGPASATCGTLVWSEKKNIVFASGGYPQKATVAVKADGSGEVLWRNKEKCYEQSLLHHEGFVYGVNDGGLAFCWDALSGEEKWKERLKGPISVSPILAAGRIYVANERGTTWVIAPNPEKFEILAENQLGDIGFATPTFLGNRIYYRTSEEGQGVLYSLGVKEKK